MEATYNPLIGAKKQFDDYSRRKNAKAGSDALREVNKTFRKVVEPSGGFPFWPVLVVITVVILMAIFSPKPAHAYTEDQLVNAIYLAEGGPKAKYPYGIRSVSCETKEECREICLKSVRNAQKRWVNSGKKEDFIIHMGRRFSPPSINPNWVRLVKYFLNMERKYEL